MKVSVCEISKANYQAVTDLKVGLEQQRYVANNALALLAATFNPGWTPLGIRDDERQALVGFLVHGLEEITGQWWLQHLMVDVTQQKRGYGRAALGHLVAQLEEHPSIKHLYAHYDPQNEAARKVLAGHGFRSTEQARDGKLVVCREMPAKIVPPLNITLREITLDNARECIQLQVAPGQARFVASNAASLVQSKFEPQWLTKAIYNGDAMVGFVMYGYDSIFGWGVLRLMIDAAYQGRGYARAAMQMVLAHIRAEGGTTVGISYEADNLAARQLYSSLGFVETGEQPFGEPFAVLALTKNTA